MTQQEKRIAIAAVVGAASCSAARRAREVLAYCKLWTEGDVETLHLRPERKVLEHRIHVISEAIQMLDDLPPNAKLTQDAMTPAEAKSGGGVGLQRLVG